MAAELPAFLNPARLVGRFLDGAHPIVPRPRAESLDEVVIVVEDEPRDAAEERPPPLVPIPVEDADAAAELPRPIPVEDA